MTNTTTSDLSSWVGRTVIANDGDKIGTITDVYLDDQSGEPEWLAVTTGMRGSTVSFVPIGGASLSGNDIEVAYDKATVTNAPNAETDGALSPQEEEMLYQHYGRGYATGAPRTGDDAMTRSEEELDIHTQTRQAGKARLRKWIETEKVHMTVPVKRETARVVTEPITDANRSKALEGADITEAEHEIVLSEEVVDVSKQVKAKERVRLEKETMVDQVAVDETVRKERVAYDDDVKIDRSAR